LMGAAKFMLSVVQKWKTKWRVTVDGEDQQMQKCWKQMKNIKLVYSNVVNAVGNQMV